MYGLTRGTATLIGVAVAGALLWLSTQVGPITTTGAYWASMGLLAGAGLAIALSQLLGGWTKWGRPRLSLPVFLLGFVPALVVGGLVLVAAQPDGATMQGTAEGWVNGLGLGWLLDDAVAVLPAVAFALGLVFGLTFDTTGARRRDEVVEDEHAHARRVAVDDPHAADEPVTAERTGTYAGEERVHDDYREPDREFVDSVATRGDGSPAHRDDRHDVDIHDGGTAVAPEHRRDRRD